MTTESETVASMQLVLGRIAALDTKFTEEFGNFKTANATEHGNISKELIDRINDVRKDVGDKLDTKLDNLDTRLEMKLDGKMDGLRKTCIACCAVVSVLIALVGLVNLLGMAPPA